MRKDTSTRSYAADELKAMRRRGEDRTDWAELDAMTEADLERAIAEDEDERDLEPDWTRAELVIPRPRQSIHLRLEPEVVDFFKAGGKAILPACKPSRAPTSTPRNVAARRRATDLLARPIECLLGRPATHPDQEDTATTPTVTKAA